MAGTLHKAFRSIAVRLRAISNRWVYIWAIFLGIVESDGSLRFIAPDLGYYIGIGRDKSQATIATFLLGVNLGVVFIQGLKYTSLHLLCQRSYIIRA